MKRWIAVLSALVMIGGCSSILNLLGVKETGSAELKKFTSEIELTNFLKDQIQSRHMGPQQGLRNGIFSGIGAVDMPLDGAPPTAITDVSGVNTSNESDDALDFSQTTLQEEGVDESDVVKTDGHYLYMINNVGIHSVLRIVDVSNPAEMILRSETSLEGFGHDIYLYDDKVISLTSIGGGFFGFNGGGIMIDPLPADDVTFTNDVDTGSVRPGSSGMMISETTVMQEPQYHRPRTVVTVIDVSDRSNPEILSTTRFDGSQSSSRFIGGVLHLVVSNFQGYYLDIMPMLGQAGLDLQSVDASTLMPRFSRVDGDDNDTDGEVVTWENLYRPTDPDGFGMVTVISVDVDNDAAFSSVGVVAEPGLVYSSINAMYLTDTNYNFNGNTRETTDIYKFTYIDRSAEASAAGTVPGRVLNQYSMGEHNGYLRVATTLGRTFSFSGQAQEAASGVYVLDETGTAMDIVGKVENIAPRETIQAARFIGDRGFVVTFEQIDPLFTLDLSDPTNPKIIGELKVPGFSTFIVPMDENHLLTIGQYIPPPGEFGPWSVQMSIYDITDFANPTVMDNVIIGKEHGAWSEAMNNPKAFTYFAESNLLALPVSITGGFTIFEDPFVDIDFGDAGAGTDGDSSPSTDVKPPTDVVVDIDMGIPVMPERFEGLVVFEATTTNGFVEKGRISTRFDDVGYYGSSFTRGVFVKDDVLAVTNRGIRGAPVGNIESVPFELKLPDLVAE